MKSWQNFGAASVDEIQFPFNKLDLTQPTHIEVQRQIQLIEQHFHLSKDQHPLFHQELHKIFGSFYKKTLNSSVKSAQQHLRELISLIAQQTKDLVEATSYCNNLYQEAISYCDQRLSYLEQEQQDPNQLPSASSEQHSYHTPLPTPYKTPIVLKSLGKPGSSSSQPESQA